MRALSPALEWSDEAYILARVEHAIRHLAWMLSEDGAKGANRPQPMATPAQVSADTARAEATDFDYIDAVLAGEGSNVSDAHCHPQSMQSGLPVERRH